MRSLTHLRLGRSAAVVSMAMLACLCLWRSGGAADSPAVSYTLREGMNEFGFWVGGSPTSNVAIGATPDTGLLLAGLRYGRVVAAWESFSLQYTLDVLPAALVFPPARINPKSSIYGAGISPIGLKLNLGQRSWIRPFLSASVGFLYFTDEVPVAGSSRFNFTPEAGVGVQFFITPSNVLTLGYKYHHISNAGMRRRNPGIDSNVIYGGFSFFTP